MTSTAPEPLTTRLEKAAEPKGTKYVVLERIALGRDDWRETANVTALSAEAAIRDALAGDTDGGTYVAVPARSWKPLTVTVETIPKITISGASV